MLLAAWATGDTSAPCADGARRDGRSTTRADHRDQAATENELDALALLPKLRYWFDASWANKA